jgi:hypothetical protein
MTQSRLSKTLLGLTLACAGFSANAYLIDFTTSDWSLANNEQSYTKEFTEGDITFFVQLEAFNSSYNDLYLSTFEDYDGGTNTDYCRSGGPLRCNIDGIGVKRLNSTRDDEVSNNELLKVSFLDANKELASVNVDSIFLLDLFPATECDVQDDSAYFSLVLDGTETPSDCIYTDERTRGGFYTIDENWGLSGVADSLLFWGDDFALAGINISEDVVTTFGMPIPVSEPETMAMFGLGLMGLGLASRKRKK